LSQRVANLIAICHRCPKRQRPDGAGGSACKLDGRDILHHAHADFCPLGKYPASDEEIEALLEQDRQRGPCCDPPPKT
jgi:hypothetical protein